MMLPPRASLKGKTKRDRWITPRGPLTAAKVLGLHRVMTPVQPFSTERKLPARSLFKLSDCVLDYVVES